MQGGGVKNLATGSTPLSTRTMVSTVKMKLPWTKTTKREILQLRRLAGVQANRDVCGRAAMNAVND